MKDRYQPLWTFRDLVLSTIAIALFGASIGCNTSKATSDGTGDAASQPVHSREGTDQASLFQDVTQQLGISFVHRPVDHEQIYFMPRSVGSGAAFFDYDGDGRLDIYLIQNGGPNSGRLNCLYRQGADGRFNDVSAGSGLDVDGYGMGVAAGDVNNDGRIDVLLNDYGQARLFLNKTVAEKPSFENITEVAGLNNQLWGTSTCFCDFDRDGWLDIILVNYVNYDPSRWCADGGGRQDFCGPRAFPGRMSKLYRNLGDDGEGVRFADVSIDAGMADHPGPGLGVFCADFDGDLWPDIFIANDGEPNHLWINQHDGTFREEAITRGLGYNAMGKSEADMGIGIGDVDSDGMFDIFITHLTTETHTLWSQGPRGIFVDRTATSGLTSAQWRGTGFGTAMVDLDNDGDLDLVIANGRVRRTTGPEATTPNGLDAFWVPYAERDQVLLNRGDGNFVDASEANEALSGLSTVSRGLACADFDNDGRMDILVTRIAGPPSLLKNVAPTGNWVMIRAIDPGLNRDAYGAEIYVMAGQNRWMRWINPGYSYLCSNDPRAHFGLGEINLIDSIEVVWPDGSREKFPGGEVNRQIEINKGKGVMVNISNALLSPLPREFAPVALNPCSDDTRILGGKG